MMKLTKAVVVLLVLILGASLVFAGGAQESAPRTRSLRMGMMEADYTPAGKAAARFAELVEEYTGGRFKVDVFYSGALGETGDAVEDVMDGSIDFWWGGISWYENFVDDFKIFSLNWAFDDNEHLARFTDSARFDQMLDELRKLNLEMISYNAYRNPRNVLSRKPISTTADLQGLMIRVPPQPMYLASWSAVGANPAQLDYGEVYTALRQGVIEAMENPIESIYGQSFQEVAKYLVETQHLLNPYTVVTNKQWLDGLDADMRDAVLRAAKDSGDYFSSIVGAEEEEIREIFKSDFNVTFVQVDIAELASRVRPIAQDLEAKGEWSQGLFDYARSLAQ